MQFAMKASPAPRRCGSVTYRAELFDFPWCGRSRTHAHRSQREDHHPRTLSFRFCSSECIFVALSARNAVMSSGARRLHSPVEACHRLQIGQPLRRSPQWSISTSGWSHCLQRLECISGPMLWGRMAPRLSRHSGLLKWEQHRVFPMQIDHEECRRLAQVANDWQRPRRVRSWRLSSKRWLRNG
jgi:hypothetical protein